MDLDYNTVKHLVIILSLLILGYVIFIVYTDLTTVRGEFNKIKTKLSETTDSLQELQKKIEYVEEEDASSEISQDNHVLHELLNNNFFSSNESIDVQPENEGTVEESDNLTSFNFSIPLFSQENNITELPDEDEDEAKDPEDIQFVTTSTQCEAIVASGKNKGKQCSKDTITDSNLCSKHYKQSNKN